MTLRRDDFTDAMDRQMADYAREHTTLGRATSALESVAAATSRHPMRAAIQRGLTDVGTRIWKRAATRKRRVTGGR